FLGQKPGIFHRMPDQEWSSEAWREGCLRFRHTYFGSRHFGRVTADKVVHRLGRRELAYRRENAEGIAGEKNDVAGMAGDAGNFGVANELNRIGSTRILRDAGVGEVDAMGCFLVYHILQDRSKSKGLENLRFRLRREIDGLGIAAAFNVKDTGVGPAMLVVSD